MEKQARIPPKKTKYAAIEVNLALPQDITTLLRRVGFKKFIILENFHYLSVEAQKTLAFDLRSFQELGIRFVILGVWREKNRLTQFNGDLQDRIIEVPVEPWSTQEFRDVIALGSDKLNISIENGIQESLIESAFDSIGVVQELVMEVCAGARVEERQPVTSPILLSCKQPSPRRQATIQQGTLGHWRTSLKDENPRGPQKILFPYTYPTTP